MDEKSVGDKGSIVLGDLQSFFDELLYSTAEKRKENFSPMAFTYVSKLLVKFHHSENFFHADSGKIPTLADLMAEAMEADLVRRVSLLKRLGDTSLMVGGYFRDSISRRGLQQSYYVQMGENAYSHLSDLSEAKNVFEELAEGFQRVSNLLSVISESIRLQQVSTLELLKMVDQSNSDIAKEKLKEQGIHSFPSRNSDRED